jgi:nitrogenase molybdenum-iron protein alpha/beta subunit|tara:strand:- start:683 stop:1213 length:531 start_codon:yes stop_codon:yes gene_type:complete
MTTLNDKLAYMQANFKSKKSRFNSFGKYNFRSAEDILEAIKPYLTELNVSVRIEEEYVEGTVPMLKSVAIFTDGKDAIHATAIVGVDLNQKGMQVPQQFGSASSYGKKYALGNLLLIDDTQDSDATNTHGKSSSKQKLSGVALEKAKEYIKNGGSIDAIKSKYDVSSAVEKQLQTL